MRKLVIAILLLSVVCCQEIVLDNYTQNQGFSKDYNNAQWNDQKELAVYGWFKINSKLPRGIWSPIFQLTSNTPDRAGEWASPGDRVLALFMINNVLAPASYSLARNDNNVYRQYNFFDDNLDQWAFFYMGHGPDQSATQIFLQIGGYTTISDSLINITHKTSSYYRIFVGQCYSLAYFPGNIFKVQINVGKGAYRTGSFDVLQLYNSPTNPNPAPAPSNLPNPLPKCVTLYTQCNFGGKSIPVCGGVPDLDVNSIKSVYVPQGTSITLFGKEFYKGKSVKFTAPVACITQLNWQFVEVEKKISSTKRSHHLKRNI